MEEIIKTVGIDEVAEALGVTRQTIRNWEKKGILHYTKVAQNHRYLVSEINEIITRNYR